MESWLFGFTKLPNSKIIFHEDESLAQLIRYGNLYVGVITH